jgi:hypothetical protein
MSVIEQATGEFQDVARELHRQLASKHDYVSDTRQVTLTEVNRRIGVEINLPGDPQTFGVTRFAHQQVAERLGIPWKFYDRLLKDHPDLVVHTANELLHREPSKRMVRTLDGNVRAFLSDRYRPRDNWDMLEKAILPELDRYPGRIWFKSVQLTDTRLYVKTVFPDIERPITPKVGDVMRGGLIFQNSEVGNGALGIFPYTDVLMCTNGMVHTDYGKRQIHVGGRHSGDDEAWEFFSDTTLALDDAAFYAKCRDIVRGVIDVSIFDRIAEQMRDLAGVEVDGAPDKVIEVFATRNNLTEVETSGMLTALIDSGDRTAWGYLNALTQTARDTEDADRQTELETLAGRIATTEKWTV